MSLPDKDELLASVDHQAKLILRELVSTPFSRSNIFDDKLPETSPDNEETEFIASLPVENDQSTNKDNSALRLLDLHPGNARFSDLAEKMKPVVVEGLEHITGVLGVIEDKNAQWISCSIIDNNDEEAFLDLKAKSNNEGPPIQGATLWAHYALFIEGNTHPLNTSKSKLNPGSSKPICLKLDEVLPGISVAGYWLRPGQRGQFLLPSSTMFGKLGHISTPAFQIGGDSVEEQIQIPPDATILMLIHSLYWVDTGAVERYDSLDEETKKDFKSILTLAENINEVGVVFHRNNRLSSAINAFNKLINILNKCTDSGPEITAFKIKTLINLAICYIPKHKIEDAMVVLDLALELDDLEKNSKYLYTRGRCYFQLYEYEDALDYFLRALKIEPNNTAIGRQLIKADELLKPTMSAEKNICQKMFNNEQEADYIFKYDKSCEEAVREFCLMVKNSYTIYPLPSGLLAEEQEIIERIVNSIGGLKIESKFNPYTEFMQKYILRVESDDDKGDIPLQRDKSIETTG